MFTSAVELKVGLDVRVRKVEHIADREVSGIQFEVDIGQLDNESGWRNLGLLLTPTERAPSYRRHSVAPSRPQ